MDYNFDVVVAGGGPAGISAAVAAARMGRKTALIERHPFLGGMGTAALVSNFCNAHHDGERFIIGGIFAELRDRLIERDAVIVTYGLEPYEPHIFRDEVAAMCREAGVELFLDTVINGVDFENEYKTPIRLQNGQIITAQTVVDASGDAAIAAGAGVPFTFGREQDGAVMPLTYCYILGPIDVETVQQEMPECILHDQRTNQPYLYLGGQPRLKEAVQQARESGELTIPRDRIAVAFSLPGRIDHIAVNFGRVFIQDPTDPEQLAQAEAEGKQQVEEGARFFQKYVPGFEKAKVTELARQIGVRESRQIVGLYTLTADDVLSYRQFDDVIAQCCYSVDIHQPNSTQTLMKSIPRGKHYDIPWRCLVPREGPANLIVAGRSISATQEAMSSFRVTPSVMAIGEAAGVTAALACEGNTSIANVSFNQVQQRLLATSGILE
jgi:glycine/D-amino acid oxidase-like deaminating enzyme